MLPLTGYGSEMRHLRQGPVHRIQRRPLEQEDEAALAAEPSFDEGHAQGRCAARARVLVLPEGEQGHESSLSARYPFGIVTRILRVEGLW